MTLLNCIKCTEEFVTNEKDYTENYTCRTCSEVKVTKAKKILCEFCKKTFNSTDLIDKTIGGHELKACLNCGTDAYLVYRVSQNIIV